MESTIVGVTCWLLMPSGLCVHSKLPALHEVTGDRAKAAYLPHVPMASMPFLSPLLLFGPEYRATRQQFLSWARHSGDAQEPPTCFFLCLPILFPLPFPLDGLQNQGWPKGCLGAREVSSGPWPCCLGSMGGSGVGKGAVHGPRLQGLSG